MATPTGTAGGGPLALAFFCSRLHPALALPTKEPLTIWRQDQKAAELQLGLERGAIGVDQVDGAGSVEGKAAVATGTDLGPNRAS